MSKRSYRRLPRRLRIENLESRVLMACDVTFDDAANTLAIVGKEGRHNIEIVGTADEIRVRCDGVDHGPFDLGKLDQVAKIVVDTTSGSDRVSFRFEDSVPELTGIDVKLGDGNDSLSLRFDDEVSTKLSVTTDLGAGNDSLTFRFDEEITAAADLKINAKLGEGNDTASFRYRDEVSGAHFITADLGGGRNSFTYEAEEEWNGSLGLGVVGGDGRDDVSIRFREEISGSVHIAADLKNGTNLFTFRADEDWQGGDKNFSTILASGGDGADTVKVRLDEDVAGLIGVFGFLGNGTNHFTVEFDEDWQNPQSKIQYVGGDGGDVVNLRFHGDIPSGLLNLVELGDGSNSFTFNADEWHGVPWLTHRPFLTVRGGADRDHIVARVGQVRGDLSIELDGGAGDDIVAATLRLPPPEAASPIAHNIQAKLNGGDGRDLLTLLAFGDPDAKNLTIEGGAGDRDTAIATSNVVVTNAERVHRVRG